MSPLMTLIALINWRCCIGPCSIINFGNSGTYGNLRSDARSG